MVHVKIVMSALIQYMNCINMQLHEIPLAFVSRCVLWAMGWNPLTPDIFRKLEHERLVLVFSHTSYVDFYILALYLMAYPDKLPFIRVLVKPQPFEYAGWLLRRFGAIPSTRIEERKGNGVQRIVQELQTLPRSVLLVSPKGTIVKHEWRTGYFHIAQQLHAPIRVTGLDYELKRVVMSKDYASVCEPELRECLYSELAQIVPLFPEDEVVEIRQHNAQKRQIANWRRITTIITAVCGVAISMLYI